MNLDDLSERIATDFKDFGVQARNLLKVLICGSHSEMDKVHIEQLRNELREEDDFKIPGTFIMEDIVVNQMLNFHQKFELIWKHMVEGDNFPLCIVYVGETSSESMGLNSEIQNIALDPDKKQHTCLIRLHGSEAVHYADEFPAYHVSSPEGFKKVAKGIVKSKINEIKSFLIHDSKKRGGLNEA